MNKLFNYNIHNVLYIISNIDNVIPEYFKEKSTSRRYDIFIRLGKFNRDSLKKMSRFAPNSYYIRNQDSVIFLIKKWSLTFYMELKDLFGPNTQLILNNTFLKFNNYFLKFPISGLYPLEHMVKLILQVKLLSLNKSFLISSAVYKNNSRLLLMSYGGIGKTTTSLNLIKKYSYNYFAEDTIIIDKKSALVYPSNIRIRNKRPNIITKNLFLDPNILYKIPKNQFSFNRIYFLTYGNQDSIYKIDFKDAFNMVMSINTKILSFDNEILINNSFFIAKFNIFEYHQRLYEIMVSFFNKKQFFLCVSRNKNFEDLIFENEKKLN